MRVELRGAGFRFSRREDTECVYILRMKKECLKTKGDEMRR